MKATGDCYESAAQFVFDRPDDESIGRRAHGLVGGAPNSEGAGLRYGHAWVERLGPLEVDEGDGAFEWPFKVWWAVDRSNGGDCEELASMYRVIGQATDVREYTLQEARHEMLEHETYGPWHHSGAPVPVEEGA